MDTDYLLNQWNSDEDQNIDGDDVFFFVWEP